MSYRCNRPARQRSVRRQSGIVHVSLFRSKRPKRFGLRTFSISSATFRSKRRVDVVRDEEAVQTSKLGAGHPVSVPPPLTGLEYHTMSQVPRFTQPLQMVLAVHEYREEITLPGVTGVATSGLGAVLAPLARARGYRSRYPQYSDPDSP